MVFAITKDLEDRRRKDGANFYCPNGHVNAWSNCENDRIRRERDLLKQNEARLEDEIRLKDRRIAEEAEKAAKLKREAARLKKRTAAGLCSCCNRTFTNMRRHMATKHPEMLGENVTPIKKKA